MNFVTTKKLTKAQKSGILLLWNQEYPANIAFKDVAEFEGYLAGLQNKVHTLAIDEGKNITGWIIDFDRDKERWLAMMIDSRYQRRGMGSRLIQSIKERNIVLNAWVIDHDHYVKLNGDVYHSPLGFYIKNGFQVVPGVVLELEILSAIKIRWKI